MRIPRRIARSKSSKVRSTIRGSTGSMVRMSERGTTVKTVLVRTELAMNRWSSVRTTPPCASRPTRSSCRPRSRAPPVRCPACAAAPRGRVVSPSVDARQRRLGARGPHRRRTLAPGVDDQAITVDPDDRRHLDLDSVEVGAAGWRLARGFFELPEVLGDERLVRDEVRGTGQLRVALGQLEIDRRAVEGERGSCRRSWLFQESGIMPSHSSPREKSVSIPLSRGEPSWRSVASSACLCAPNRASTRAASSGAAAENWSQVAISPRFSRSMSAR